MYCISLDSISKVADLLAEKETIDFEKSKIDLELNKWFLKFYFILISAR